MPNIDDIKIIIDTTDDILDSKYPQYMIDFLANVNPPITNTLHVINDISYIIYNKVNPHPPASDIKIYINDTAPLNISYVH